MTTEPKAEGVGAVATARDAAIQQAQQWKMEAESANATIAEIYRLVGSKAGNWNGARPVREHLAHPTPSAVEALARAAERASVLVRLLTIRQVIESGDDAIDAAGLNPYCMNEGLAEGHETIGFWHLDTALAHPEIAAMLKGEK